MILLCRNRVEDYDHWRKIFDANLSSNLSSNLDSPKNSGLEFIQSWREVDDPNNVFFTFKVTDRKRAEAFLADPASAQTGVEARVIDGECFFLEDA